jgi:hypothetical protein
LFKGDLRQNRSGDVSAGLCIVDEKILAPLHHRREIIERYKGEGAGVIEAPVCVFLDDGSAIKIWHWLTPEPDGIAKGAQE